VDCQNTGYVLHTLDLGVSARLAGSILHAWTFPPESRKEDGAGNAAKVWAILKEAYAELGIKENSTIWWCRCSQMRKVLFLSLPNSKGMQVKFDT
jgi:hypothetical protein